MRSLTSVPLALALTAVALRAAPIDYSFTSLNKAVPDGSAAGITDTQTIITPFTQLTSLSLSLTITGRDDFYAFNGDLYATLVHDGGFAVLLNRPGRTAANPFGYADNGMAITLSDLAVGGNVHNYATTVSVAFDAPLLGTWSPDGRVADPTTVLDTSPVSALLSDFHGLDPNGSWTLYLADLEPGGLAALDSWSLRLEGISPIPEPPTSLALSLMVLTSLWAGRRYRRPTCRQEFKGSRDVGTK